MPETIQSPILARQMENSAPFAAVRNRIRMHRQYEELSRIVDSAGELLCEADRSGDKILSGEMIDIICSVTFMVSTLEFLMAKASRGDMESSAVLNLIDQAEVMSWIMSSVVIH